MVKSNHTIRIISGSHRSRRLPVLDFDGLRPTGDRVRETLFNWLQMSIAGKTVLDLCAGTGALGFEAASRGAKSVTLIEKNRKIATNLNDIQQDFKFKNVEVINISAQQFIATCVGKYDIVFIDPPFAENLVKELTELAIPLVKSNGYIYTEAAIDTELQQFDKNWQLTKQKTFGKVKIELWQPRL